MYRVVGYIPSRPVHNVLCVRETDCNVSSHEKPVGGDAIKILNQMGVLNAMNRDTTRARQHNISRYGPSFGITLADTDGSFEALYAGRKRRVKLHDITCRGSKRIKIKPIDDPKDNTTWSVTGRSSRGGPRQSARR